jgi:hypothetical protein
VVFSLVFAIKGTAQALCIPGVLELSFSGCKSGSRASIVYRELALLKRHYRIIDPYKTIRLRDAFQSRQSFSAEEPSKRLNENESPPTTPPKLPEGA